MFTIPDEIHEGPHIEVMTLSVVFVPGEKPHLIMAPRVSKDPKVIVPDDYVIQPDDENMCKQEAFYEALVDYAVTQAANGIAHEILNKFLGPLAERLSSRTKRAAEQLREDEANKLYTRMDMIKMPNLNMKNPKILASVLQLVEDEQRFKHLASIGDETLRTQAIVFLRLNKVPTQPSEVTPDT